MSAQPQPTTFERKWFWLVCALFFASGLSSLIYQVAWTRHLVLIFGSTTLATSTVLAVFMGGLALGSFFAGRMTDKLQRPFLWYGILEGLIGAWALFVPVLLATAVSTYRVVWELTHFDFFTFSLVRLTIAAAILLFPTTLMGATLPLLSKFVTDSLANVGQRVGTIYAINTLGAVAGAALTGFYLLPTIGLAQTTVTSASINMLLCVAVVFAAMKLERIPAPVVEVEKEITEAVGSNSDGPPKHATKSAKSKSKKKRAAEAAAALAAAPVISEETTDQPIKHTKISKPHGKLTLALIAIGISGAAAMVYEVCWTRTLSMIIGGSTYAFTVMLTTFLAGIFAGGFVCAKFVDKIKRPFLAFGILQILVAVGCLLSLTLTRFLPEWNVFFNYILPRNPVNVLGVRFVLAEAALLPVTIFLGALFPVVIKCCASDLSQVGRSVGTVYSANTLGAIVGSLASGFLLIPQFGVENTILIAVGTNLVAGAALIFAEKEARFLTKFAYVLTGVVALIVFMLVPTEGNQKSFLLAQSARRAMRDGHNVLDKTQPWPRSMARASVEFFKDGPCSNVAIMKFPNGGDTSYALLTNGCVDASDGADMSQQVLLATYPYLFRPYARKACVIGWGSGVTVSSLLNFPIDSVTAVELEPAVIDAAKVF
ncbi:MAG: fused MFS/spermidine synthase, partial [Leptolyngbya sp.]|nr:fused MFS/spermidine synthase [Candidatus Melainabacteria bacterium]